ncbi:hypothetical protein [Marivirga arenosa]|uniref:Uncharacterized protein n=1 Tax=Marivirga arenosa TaxID=3059076 RepID=A0AA49JCK4_9BACT|nr:MULTISPECIES: hypothetical protein [unclassified Marivirga]WKK79652.2 hypothetical protein QYS47_20270 [Marivirga sp. BKB1-2]WKK85262.2 hypothetical protein QYS48_25415 [Marivirga sp. ABR2-2]
MEGTVVKSQEKSTKVDDWKAARSFYSCKNGICDGCLSKYEFKNQLILPLSKLSDKDFKFDINNFIKSLAKFKRPILFYHQNIPIEQNALIKFTGHENFEDSFKVLKPFLPETTIPATIISPYNLSKNNRLKEQQLVKLTKKFFEPLGFIKLHLHSVAEFHNYGKQENIGLLCMPLKDLPDYIQFARNAEAIDEIIPTIFQP